MINDKKSQFKFWWCFCNGKSDRCSLLKRLSRQTIGVINASARWINDDMFSYGLGAGMAGSSDSSWRHTDNFIFCVFFRKNFFCVTKHAVESGSLDPEFRATFWHKSIIVPRKRKYLLSFKSERDVSYSVYCYEGSYRSLKMEGLKHQHRKWFTA